MKKRLVMVMLGLSLAFGSVSSAYAIVNKQEVKPWDDNYQPSNPDTYDPTGGRGGSGGSSGGQDDKPEKPNKPDNRYHGGSNQNEPPRDKYA